MARWLDSGGMTMVETVLSRVPEPLRSVLIKHR
jgi:hypothetical protein